MFDLTADAPEAAAVFESATKTLDGCDPRELVRNESGLYVNKTGQILCCTSAMAAWAALSPLISDPLVVAGYSIGELAAWGVAGVFGASEILELAATRAAAMDSATKEPSGLAAIRGLTRQKLNSLCNLHGAYLAIINTADQMLIGGTCKSILAVIEDAKAAGANRTTLLRVSVASHTPLLQQASQEFGRALRSQKLPDNMPSGIRLLSSIDGSPVFALSEGIEKLAQQIQQTVEWAACMEACRSARVTKVLELGPGNALARMMQELFPSVSVHSVSEFRTLAGLRHWLTTPSVAEPRD